MRLINPITIFILGALIWAGLIFWAHQIGVQHGKDYMAQHYYIIYSSKR